MNRRDNPYTPGAGRRPAYLAGRANEIGKFNDLVARITAGDFERSLIFSGLRGVGKTVLLMELELVANEAGWITSDVQEVGSQPDFRLTFARMAARLLRELSPQENLRSRVQRALSVVKAFSVTSPVGGLQLQLDVEATHGVADSGDPEQDLADLLREVGQVALDAGTAALFVVDEMQNLPAQSLAAICIAFQAISREKLPIAFVGAGLPDLPLRLLTAKKYADRLFQYFELGRLADDQARLALAEPAQTKGVTFDPSVIERVGLLSAGYPYFIQEFGRELWDHAPESPISVSDLGDVEPLVTDGLDRTFFGPRFEMASETEQRYLAAMASVHEGGPVASSAVMRAFGANVHQQVTALRDSVIQKDLVWSPKRGLLDFTVPLFADFLRKHHPVRNFEA